MLTRVSLFFALALVLHAANPNIIYILADDQGYGDVGAFNPESKIATPNLDRLAGDGMRFTDAHSSSSVCTPTRYSVLTGRYHWRTRLQSGVLGGFSKHLIAPERMTVASLLRENGYATACIGKWHLGMDWPLKAGGFANTGNADGDTIDFAGRIVNGPIANGFDYFFGISASLDMPPYLYIENDRATAIPNEQMSRGRKGPKHSDFTLEGVLPDVTAKTVEVIGQRAKKDKPFFIYMPLNAPHTPIVPVAEFAGKSGINRYADFVMQIDHSVGQVMAALDAHKIAENTLIIFTTDNGCSPAARIPELQAKGHEPSYIYRGHKADIFEGGHRVPFIARWPAKVAAGSSSDALVGQLDLLATCAGLVGAKIPATAGEDSNSFLPILLGESGTRSALVHQSITGAFAIRQGKWKLALCPGSGGWSAPRPGRNSLEGLPPLQLFDLEADPGETNNLHASNPEVVERLTTLLAGYIETGRSTPGASQKNDAKIIMLKPIKKVTQKKKKKSPKPKKK